MLMAWRNVSSLFTFFSLFLEGKSHSWLLLSLLLKIGVALFFSASTREQPTGYNVTKQTKCTRNLIAMSTAVIPHFNLQQSTYMESGHHSTA
jgi:hypothetical protein